jgi:hypothetical protein
MTPGKIRVFGAVLLPIAAAFLTGCTSPQEHGADRSLDGGRPRARVQQSFVDKLRQDVRQGQEADSAGKRLDRTIRTGHLLYHYSDGDSVDVKRFEAFLAWFTAQTGITPPDGIQIFKYRDRAHLKRLTRNAVNGFAIPGRLEVHTIWPFDPHELVHVLIEHQARWPVPFLAEGTAMAYDVDPLAGRYHPIWHSKDLDVLARGYRDADKIPPLADLLEARAFQKLSDSVTYPIAGSFVRYLIRTHGAGKLLELHHRVAGRGSVRQIRAAFQSVYDVPLDQEWQRWLDWLGQ